MHINEGALIRGVITYMVKSYKADVAITEMDVHTLDATLQANICGAFVNEAVTQGFLVFASEISQINVTTHGCRARSHYCSTSARTPKFILRHLYCLDQICWWLACPRDHWITRDSMHIHSFWNSLHRTSDAL